MKDKKDKKDGQGYYAMIEMDLVMDTTIPDAAIRLYCFIANYANNKNGYCYLTHVQIREILKVSKAQFYRNLKILIEKGYISKLEKNNRIYLQPTMNAFIWRRSYVKTNHTKVMDYDWLNE